MNDDIIPLPTLERVERDIVTAIKEKQIADGLPICETCPISVTYDDNGTLRYEYCQHMVWCERAFDLGTLLKKESK